MTTMPGISSPFRRCCRCYCCPRRIIWRSVSLDDGGPSSTCPPGSKKITEKGKKKKGNFVVIGVRDCIKLAAGPAWWVMRMDIDWLGSSFSTSDCYPIGGHRGASDCCRGSNFHQQLPPFSLPAELLLLLLADCNGPAGGGFSSSFHQGRASLLRDSRVQMLVTIKTREKITFSSSSWLLSSSLKPRRSEWSTSALHFIIAFHLMKWNEKIFVFLAKRCIGIW